MKNLKALMEKQAELQMELQGIVEKADAEVRAMNSDEFTRFDEIKNEIEAIDKTVTLEERSRNIEKKSATDEVENRAEIEEKSFADFILGKTNEERAQLTQGNNGAIVPLTIANKIVVAVRDLVPFLQLADVVSTNGKLAVPLYNEDATDYISADYVDENTDLSDNVGKFTSIDLTGYVVGALALVSNKLKDNADINVVDFIVNQVAEAIAIKLEKEFINGTPDKIAGITSTTTTITTAAPIAVTYDELVSLKHSLKQRFRANAVLIMHPSTYTALCKLKDQNGQPYFKEDAYKMLELKVIESDSMPEIKAGAKAIICADLKGYTIKATKAVEIQILREKFATKNMLGVLAFGEYDAKITDMKRITALTMKA